MMQKKRLFPPVSLVVSLSLAGCGGGGGGSGDTQAAPPTPDPVEYVFEPIEPAALVTTSVSGEALPTETVAVLDTGVNLDHEAFAGQTPTNRPIVAGTTDSAARWCRDAGESDCGAFDDVTDEYGHGTATASLIAGNRTRYSSNAQVSIYDVTDREDGLIAIPWVTTALYQAAENGERIANLSFGLDMPSLRQSLDPNTSYGAVTGAHVDRFVRSGGVMVSAAGNEGISYSSVAGESWARERRRADSMLDQYLVAGSLWGDSLAAYSNFAGENRLVQTRFLVTQGQHRAASVRSDTGYETVAGTSFAAPILSAGMATLLSLWDHLTPAEAAQRLLDTTERRFANENDVAEDDYGDASCGASGEVDCGLYTYGQGRLDLDAALAPEGVPAIATAARVPDADHRQAGVGIDRSGLVLPAGLGDAGERIAAAVGEVQVFDDLGRDYTANLASMVQTHRDPTAGLGFRMSEALTAGLTAPVASNADEATGTRQTVGLDAGGRVNMAAVGVDAEAHGLGLTAYHFGNGASAPDAAGFRPMGMVSYSGNTPMADQLDAANGVNVDVPLAGNLSLTSGYWQGEKRLSLDRSARANRISNIAVGLKATLVDGVDVTAGYASLDESAGVMGMTGMGGFATDGGSSMGLMQLGLNARFGAFQAFVNYQGGQVEATFGNSLISRLKADVEQMAVGASYGFDAGRRQVAFVASQPMHLTDGSASLRLAADRTREGEVIYRHESVDFSAAGAPTNYEFGYRQRIGKHALFGLNAVRMENGPNRGDGGVDHGAMAMVSLRF